jgi:hypothetical protein
MSLIFADSFGRYQTVDKTSVVSSLARYGWSSGGNIHNRTDSLFGANHLQIQDGGSGKSSFTGYISRTIPNTTSLGVSFKYCPFLWQVGSGQVREFVTIRMSLSNGQYVDLVANVFSSHNNTFANNANIANYINGMNFRHQGSLLNISGAAVANRSIDFTSEHVSTYTISASGSEALWMSTFPVINWVHLDFVFNAVTKIFSARMVFPSGNFYTITSGAFTPLANGLTITALTLYGTNQVGQKASDFILWTQDSVGFSSLPDSPRNLRVQRLSPTANGTFNTWTPSSGSNFSAINEVPYSDAQFITGSGIGSKQTFLMGGLGSGINSIKSGLHGIQLNPHIYDAGSSVSVATPIQVISGTETALGSGITPSRVSYTVPSRVITINPQTSGQYTASQVNAMETGFNIQ